MSDDLKRFRALSIWPLVWGAGFAALVLAAIVIPDNAERQVTSGPAQAAGNQSAPAVSAPYQDCQKTVRDAKGKTHWLRWQVAHFPEKDPYHSGKFIWRIDCSYGDRGELQL